MIVKVTYRFPYAFLQSLEPVLQEFSPRFPYSDDVNVAGRRVSAREVLRILGPRLTDARRARLKRAAEARTCNLVPALEGLSDPGNVNAALRSAEGLGCGAVHLVALEGNAVQWAEQATGEHDSEDALRDARAGARVSQGAEKWMHLQRFASPTDYVDWARGRGFRLVATALTPGAVSIESVDFSPPTALVIGNERDGVSNAMLEAADEVAFLPIDGLIQSYNASVAVALALYQARRDRMARLGRHADLSAQEREVLFAHYVMRAVSHATAILKRELGRGD